MHNKWKSAQTQMQTLCAGCSKAEPKIFHSPTGPIPGAHDCQNLISWCHYLYLQTQFGEDRCTQFRVIVVTDPQTHIHSQTHKQTHRQDRLQYITPQQGDLGVDSRSRLESTWRSRVESSRFYLLKSISKSNSLTEVTSSRFRPKSTWKRLEAKFMQLSSRTVGLLLRFLDAYY